MSEMFPDGTLAYINGYEAEVRRLSRLRVQELREEYRKVLAGRGVLSMSNPPSRKDELVSASARELHPRWKEAYEERGREINARNHAMDIQGLAFRLGSISDDDLAAVLRETHAAARRRLREMLAQIVEDAVAG